MAWAAATTLGNIIKSHVAKRIRFLIAILPPRRAAISEDILHPTTGMHLGQAKPQVAVSLYGVKAGQAAGYVPPKKIVGQSPSAFRRQGKLDQASPWKLRAG